MDIKEGQVFLVVVVLQEILEFLVARADLETME